MGRENVALMAFNRGKVSRLALARTDIKRVALSSSDMENWMARVLGSMMLRPGWEYLGAIPSAPRFIPFIFATSDTALCEFTNGAMRVWVNDSLVTRVSVATALTNGTFDTNLTGWTDNDESGGTSVWVTGGYMGLTGNGTSAAIRDQMVTVALGDSSKEHALNIEVFRGPVMLRVGTTLGDDDLINETELSTGSHSLAFTPTTGPVWVRFFSRLKRQVLVDSCVFASAGVMSLSSPYETADLDRIRFDESADVIYLSCYGTQQRKVERRSTHSWSLVRYQANDGPLRVANVGPITITPSALSGNITLTASAALFKSTNAPSTDNDGSLFRITSNGQNVSASIAAQNTFTNAIQVEGTGNQRVFTVTIDEDAAGAATFTLQRSLVGDTGPWTDVQQWTADVVTPFDDGLDNQIAWYRLGVKTGDYVNGTHAVSLAYTVGSIDGYVRITGFTTALLVDAEVLSDLGGTAATDDWAEGEWSDRRGWPSANTLYEGRCWFSGKQGIWGSISDGYQSFDESVEGDSGTINREIGSGPVDNINWMLPVARLIVGSDGAEHSCKSSSFDEPLTPTAFQIKADSTQGSHTVGACKVDAKGVFVQQSGTRVFELDKGDGVDYGAVDLTIMIPEQCEPEIVRMAVQRKPDTRIHCVLSDGSVAVAVYDRAENVICWLDITTRDGDEVVDVVVLPPLSDTGEDQVYYAVKRTINGADVYHLEKWALESECVGGTINKQADAFFEYGAANISGSTISGATHLVGADVVVWDAGRCLRDSSDEIETFTVNGAGEITVTDAGAAYLPTGGILGLAYRARWKSTKLQFAAEGGSPLNQRGIFQHLGVVLDRTHHRGLKYGPSFDRLSPLPLVEGGVRVVEGTIYDQYDHDPFEFEGEWSTDSRLCLQADAPRPCTVLAATMQMEKHAR